MTKSFILKWGNFVMATVGAIQLCMSTALLWSTLSSISTFGIDMIRGSALVMSVFVGISGIKILWRAGRVSHDGNHNETFDKDHHE